MSGQGSDADLFRTPSRCSALHIWREVSGSSPRDRVSDALRWPHRSSSATSDGAPPTTRTLARESPWRWRNSNRLSRKYTCRSQLHSCPLSRENKLPARCRNPRLLTGIRGLLGAPCLLRVAPKPSWIGFPGHSPEDPVHPSMDLLSTVGSVLRQWASAPASEPYCSEAHNRSRGFAPA